MSKLNFDGMDKVLKDKLEFFVKLLDTKPEVFINFLIEVGLKMLVESESVLKAEFKKFLKGFGE